jgi:hypothetical protein
MLEVSSDERFSNALELHVVEFPKLAACNASSESDLVRWGQFFAAETDEELEQLAKKAREVLENLSGDPSVQELARQRELTTIGYQLDLQAARKQGEASGRGVGGGIALRDAAARLCKHPNNGHIDGGGVVPSLRHSCSEPGLPAIGDDATSCISRGWGMDGRT